MYKPIRHIHIYLFTFLTMIFILNALPCYGQILETNKQTQNTYKDTLNILGHEGEKQQLYLDWCHDFAFLNQDIYVNYIFPEKIEGINTLKQQYPNFRITTLLIYEAIQKNKSPFDFIGPFGHVQYDELNRLNMNPPHYFIDFSNSVWFEKAHKPHIYDDKNIFNKTKGLRTGPVIEGSYYALSCNMDLAEKMGLNIKQFNMTTNDLIEYARQIHEYNQQNNTQYYAFYDASDWVNLYMLFETFFKSSIGFTSTYKKPERFDTTVEQHTYQVLKIFEELGKYNPLTPKAEHNIWSETTDQILKDETVFFINGTWMYSIWNKIDSVKVQKIMPCELPVIKPYTFYPAEFLAGSAIPKNAPHKNAAIKFMKSLCSKDFAEDWITYTKSPTGLNQHIQATGLGGDHYEKFIQHIDQKYKNNLHIASNWPFFFGVNVDFNKNIHEMLKGNMTAEAGIQWIKDQIE